MSAVALRVTAASHRGHVRERNEDALGVQGWTAQRGDGRTVQIRVVAEPSVACVVADGLGGHVAGHIASRLAAETISGELRGNSSDHVREVFLSAHERIRAAASASGQIGMGTTAVALCLTSDSMVIANVGDSRLYELADGLIRLSHDDNPEQPPERSGVPVHTLTQALGLERAPAVHLDRLQTEPGLRFVLCTDGLTDLFSDGYLGEVCARSAQDEVLVTQLIGAALAAGAPDNVTVAVAEVEKVETAFLPPTVRRGRAIHPRR
jgi:serine/threonine protein phosphatase PrpC